MSIARVAIVNERRAAPRYPAFINASVLAPDETLIWSGLMTDMSETGGQLNIARHFKLPDSFILHESFQDNVFHCVTMWRKEDRTGFRFLDMCGMATRRRLIQALATDRREISARISFYDDTCKVA